MLKKVGLSFYFGRKRIEPYFEEYFTYEDYANDNLDFVEPMTAKEVKPELLEKMLAPNSGFYAEEKFDGTRATLHLLEDGINRVFSRRVSSKTGWLVENSDLLPQLRDVEHSYTYTILDGELIIPNRPFIDASSTMNCKWFKALERQLELGMIVFNAFDIIRFDGNSIEHLPLSERKEYLREVVEDLNSPYIQEVVYFDNFITIDGNRLSKQEYYDHIVRNGGEGLILKDNTAIYERGKRTNAFVKLKKYDTWDCVITGFAPPKKEFEGKTDLTKWQYFEDGEPVTKFYANNWIGAIKFGVYKDNELFTVGECSGMDEETRALVSENQADFIGKVIEVKAQEVIKKTGALRHPQFLRFREDKDPQQCTWENHIRK